MSPMPVTDSMFLVGESRERPMHVGGLQIFRLPEDAEPHHVRAVYRDLLEHGEVVPRLRRRAVRGLGDLGMWHWEDDPNLDLEYHLRHSALPDPGRIRELLALVSRLHGTLLDRSRPLWESHLIEGLADGRIATYTKVHHAMMDGISANRLLEQGLTDDPDRRDMAPPMFLNPGEARRQRERQARPGPLTLAREAVGLGVEGVKGALGASSPTALRPRR
jgi:diacylglycerol O-acyltransferase / wax synthase